MNKKSLYLSLVLLVISYQAKCNDTLNLHKIIIGYAVQDNGEEEYKFSESRDDDSKFAHKEMYYRFDNEPEKWRSLGLLAKNLKPILKTNELAYKSFKKYRRKVILGRTCFVGGIVLIAPIYLLNKKNGIAIILAELAITSTSGMLLVKNSEKMLYQAIDIYNK